MEANATPAWSLSEKIFFRFALLYLALYLFPFPLNAIPLAGEAVDNFFSQGWDLLVVWTSRHILHLEHDVSLQVTGSGDGAWNYVLQFVVFALAALGTALWTLADRQPRRYERWYFWLRVFVRYYLAYTLMSYGFFKLIKTQFPFPTLLKLTRPLGDASPMGLAWDFMGFSIGYNFFTGGMEVLGGLLLLFRRTTLLGALVVIGVMSNVVAMNFCFDIPVKLYSANLLLFAVFLLLPDGKRLARFFLFNQSVEPQAALARSLSRRQTYIANALKIILIGVFLYNTISTPLEAWAFRSGPEGKSALYGIYYVESFERGDSIIPPLATDSTRWKRIIFSEWNRARIDLMTDSSNQLVYNANTAAQEVVLHPRNDTVEQTRLTYRQLPDDYLTLSGVWQRDSVRIRLKKYDANRFLLVNRGFHWVNETPLNK